MNRDRASNVARDLVSSSNQHPVDKDDDDVIVGGKGSEGTEGYEQLLNLTWRRIVSIYVQFPNVMKQAHPHLMGELAKFLDVLSDDSDDLVVIPSPLGDLDLAAA